MNTPTNTFAQYRGFEIGAKPSGIKTFWRAMWRDRGEMVWTEGNILCDDAEDAARCARECVDYEYRVAAWEFEQGRNYNPMTDGLIPSND